MYRKKKTPTNEENIQQKVKANLRLPKYSKPDSMLLIVCIAKPPTRILNLEDICIVTIVCCCVQDAQGCDSELHSLRDDQKTLGQLLETKQIKCRELEGNTDSLDGDVERQMEMKQRVSLRQSMAARRKSPPMKSGCI